MVLPTTTGNVSQADWLGPSERLHAKVRRSTLFAPTCPIVAKRVFCCVPPQNGQSTVEEPCVAPQPARAADVRAEPQSTQAARALGRSDSRHEHPDDRRYLHWPRRILAGLPPARAGAPSFRETATSRADGERRSQSCIAVETSIRRLLQSARREADLTPKCRWPCSSWRALYSSTCVRALRSRLAREGLGTRVRPLWESPATETGGRGEARERHPPAHHRPGFRNPHDHRACIPRGLP